MTHTPEQLDALVTKLGNYVEKNYNELTNKKHSVLRSSIAVLFNAASGGTKALRNAAKAYGIEVTGWHSTLDKIVELTEARGSNAADKIKVTVEKTKQLDVLFERFQIKGTINQVRYSKKFS